MTSYEYQYRKLNLECDKLENKLQRKAFIIYCTSLVEIHLLMLWIQLLSLEYCLASIIIMIVWVVLCLVLIGNLLFYNRIQRSISTKRDDFLNNFTSIKIFGRRRYFERDDPMGVISYMKVPHEPLPHNYLKQPYIEDPFYKDEIDIELAYGIMKSFEEPLYAWRFTPFIPREREEIHYDFQSRKKQ